LLASLCLLGACSGSGGLLGSTTSTSTTTPATTEPSTLVPSTLVPSTGAPSSEPGSSAPTTSSLNWGACTGTLRGSGLQCATLPVPLDYADPAGAKIELALDRVQATGNRLGSLLVNPGGPGASGLQFLQEVYPALTSGLTTHFDIIGFDPRGVGASTPVVCGTSAQLDGWLAVNDAPTTAAGIAALVTADRQLAQACQTDTGALLGHVGTTDAARDMESIRVALGDPQLNYLGFSYGTFLGARYADLYPTHIRAMVLDGAEDPQLDEITTVNTQSAALENELNSFFAWCAAGNGCQWKPAGGRPKMQTALLGLINSAIKTPLPGSGGRSLGPNEVMFGVVDALYTTSTWPELGVALGQAEKGSGRNLLAMYDDYVERGPNGQYQNLIVANSAVTCDDTPRPTESAVLAAAPTALKVAPVFGLANLYSLLQCTVWPTASTDDPHAIRAPGSPPIVVVGSTGDPATPYAWAQGLARQLSRGVLVTRVGEGHTGYLFSSCVRNLVDTYMVDLTPPANGTTCQSDS
jgi:pimeloyl-ACP methyl ester carboxylesterase